MPNIAQTHQLLEQGKRNIELAEHNMAALMAIRSRFKKEKPFQGLRIAMALHLTKETAILVQTLVDGGARVAICSCNPLSTQDDVAAALAQYPSVQVYGYKGESAKDYYRFLETVAATKPHLVIDDGCDLITILLKHPNWAQQVKGACEETTTGVQRLRAMEQEGLLPFPVIAVNDNLTKHLMDNIYGTGQSTLDGILRATNLMFAGKTAVVAGYGSCGKGVAMRLRGEGAQVVVTEVNPFRALQAHMDGYRVLPMNEAAVLGDLFITVTGNVDVLTLKHVKRMKEGAILANSGHFDVEIDVKGLRKAAKKTRLIRPFMEEFSFSFPDGSKRIYILAEGRLVNLAAAEGHPSEVMSLSFCGQALACEYLMTQKNPLMAGVHRLPNELDSSIAALQLKVQGVRMDRLSSKQIHYLNNWESGT